MSDNFEQHLQRQSPREIPGEWRGDILRAALVAVPQPGFLSTIHHLLSTFSQPRPRAWAALAAIWVIIIALNFSLRDTSPQMAITKPAPTSRETVMALRQQNLLVAEWAGPRGLPTVDRPRKLLPQPHSWRMGETLNA